MSDLIKTLHKKGDNTVNVYPNIKSENIPDDAITTSKISNNAVTTAKISNNAITYSKLAGNSVTSAKIESGAVTTDKLGAGSVTADKISSEAITTAKLFDRAVTTAKIENGAITTDKLAYGAVTTDRIADGAVTNTEIANGTIESTKLADRLYTHAIKVHLKDTVSNVTFFLGFNILSKSDSSLILQFSDLLDALKPFEKIVVSDIGNDKIGYIGDVDFQGNGYIGVYLDDNGSLTEYEFDEIVADASNDDKITLLY